MTVYLVVSFQVTEIVNVAVLTGRVQEYPLQVYAVDDTDKFSEVTQQTKCHSVEVDVLKVGLVKAILIGAVWKIAQSECLL